MSDSEFVQQKRRADDRTFLINSLDPEKAPRLAPGMRALRQSLAGGGWVRHDAVLAAGLRASDLTVKTVDAQLRRAVTAGMVEKRGEYTRAYRGRPAEDSRKYRLKDWPTHVD